MAVPRPSTLSAATELEDHLAAQLEDATARAIVGHERSAIRFNPDHDFIEHALPGSTHVWQYKGDRLVIVDEGVALEA